MAKGKGGTGRGTDKKGWNRWQASANRIKNAPKPYKSKGTKAKSEAAAGAAGTSNGNGNKAKK
ncbi:uncharacterized protein DUF3934 [Paenibacillus cellulosilyticus]|uniref:Uncharacterized protein DUF3934 n=1 Tax=Paenibacillus cellulosilyticus TaxID=375489 RepID=A0A2V2YPS3_9BACL|nr:DUF3934 family protein [Paenibacillus cellulosilyticus]PWV98510.1 uncharacterized protein DUF3934 [Paenibacillus cellulosilyticus]QKS44119.1 DUF3934 family protein [Paenibacillus cellulosilyticus]